MLSMVGFSRPSDATAHPEGRPGRALRARRLRALGLDVTFLIVTAVAGTVLGLAWIFFRTGFGGTGPGDGDAAIGVAFTLGAPLAWLAWTAFLAIDAGHTPGQALTGLTVTAGGRSRLRRVARFGVSPLGAVAWAGLGVLLILGAVPWAPLLPLAAGLIVGALAVVSLGGLMYRPGSPALHDRIAGTRVVDSRSR